MPYGTLKADTLTYYTATGDVNLAISGIAISGSPLISGVSGVFTTSVSGATVTGNAGQFTTITGGTAQFTNITGVSGTFTSRISGATVTGTSGQFTTITATTGIFTTSISGATISGDVGLFTTISGSQGVFNSGLSIPSGTAASPSISFNGDPNTGLYSSGADAVAISTNGTGKLFIDSSGVIEGYNTQSTGAGIVTGLRLNSARATGGDGTEITFNLDFPGYSALAGIAGVFSGGGNNGHLIFKTVNSGTYAERLRITSAGLVGIGTNDPQTSLVVAASLPVIRSMDSDGTNLYSDFYNNNGATIIDSRDNAANGAILFRGGGGGVAAEYARFDSTGKLGIGLSNPGYTLDVAGSARIGAANTSTVVLEIGAGATGNRIAAIDLTGDTTYTDYGARFIRNNTGANADTQIIHRGTGSLNLTAVEAGSITASTSNTERLRITSAGLVGIGTASPSFPLEVATSGSNATLQLIRSDAATAGVLQVTSANSVNSILSTGSKDLNFSTNSTERARIDSSGRLLVGTSTSRTVGRLVGTGNFPNQYPEQIEGAGSFAGLSLITNRSVDETGSVVTLGKSRSASSGGVTIVNNGDDLGVICFAGADGTDIESLGGAISCQVDGTPGSNDMPGRLVFSTTADGASSPTERVRISQNGVVTVKNGAVAEIGTLTDGATVTPDFAANCNFTLTISGNRTLANPTNITAGQTGSIFIIQGSGSNTLSWGSYWDFAGGTAPTLSTASGAVDRVDYVVRTSTSIHTVFTANYS